MTAENKPVQNWILIVTALLALMEIMVSVALVFAPESVVETVDLNAKGVTYIIYMWAARQFALGVIFGYSAFRKSVPMLTISYVFFLVMFVGDALIGVAQKDTSLLLAGLVMCAIASAMIFAINKRR